MQQLVYLEPGRLEWQEAPDLEIESPAEALVEPVAVAVCDLDALVIRGLIPLFQGPYPFGHEGVGRVAEVGEKVGSVKPGDLVVIPFQISCGECSKCGHGTPGSCERFKAPMYGMGAIGGDWGGFMSELVRVPFADAMLVPLPSGIDPASVASMSDNIPDAYRTVGPQLRERQGESVLIVGGGAPSIPLYAVQCAVASGAGEVHFIDTDDARLKLAESLGAEVHEGPPPRRLGRHAITVDASATPEGLACAIRSTSNDGICTSIGIYYNETTPMPLLDMYVRNITFHTGRPHARALIPEILELVVAGRLEPERVTSATVPWVDAVDALIDPPTKLILTR